MGKQETDEVMIGPGTQLGRYRLVAPIGRGGMSAVYRAYDPTLDRQVAIKILKAELARDKVYRRRFQEEAHALGKVSHPNLVPIYAVGQEGAISYYAMELIEGPTLREVLNTQHRLRANEALAVFKQFLSGLNAVHQAGIVHRDIKPGNVMLDGTGRVRLMDFGLARRIERESLTLAGDVLGTPQYMSPEQAQGAVVDARSDLYAAGVVLFEMLAGQPPFKGSDTIAILRAHVEEPPPPLQDLAPDISPELAQLVNRLLAKKPDRRYAHVRELLAALEPITCDELNSQECVQKLAERALQKRAKPTRTIDSAASWEWPTASQPSGAESQREPYEKLRTGLAVASAVIAVLALILAIVSVMGGPKRPASPQPMPRVTAPSTDAPVSGPLWKVTLREGVSFSGKLLPWETAVDGKETYLFENLQQEQVEVSASNLRKIEKGGELK